MKINGMYDQIIFDYKMTKAKNNPAILSTVEGYVTFKDRENTNKRIYPNTFWDWAVDENQRLQDMLKTKTLFGNGKHPGKDDSPFPELETVTHAVRKLKVDDVGVYATIDILNNTNGEAIQVLLDYGSSLGISTRAFGKQKERKDGLFEPIREDYLLVTWDFVSFPAFRDARFSLADSFEIDVKDLVVPSIDDLKEKMCDLSECAGLALCNYVGLELSDFKSSKKESDSEVVRLEKALVEAIGTIKVLKDSLESLSKNQPKLSILDKLEGLKVAAESYVSVVKGIDKIVLEDTKIREEVSEEFTTEISELVSQQETAVLIKDSLIEECAKYKNLYEDSCSKFEELEVIFNESVGDLEKVSNQAVLDLEAVDDRANNEIKDLNIKIKLLEDQLSITEEKLIDAQKRVNDSSHLDKQDKNLNDSDTIRDKEVILPVGVVMDEDSGLSKLMNRLV